jgi:hypothetical protein
MLVASVAVWFAEPRASLVVAGVGLLLTVFMEGAALVNRQRRQWIEVLDDGFKVIDSRGERTYRDDQVHSLAYALQDRYSNGELKGFIRRCKLWALGEAEPIGMENRFASGQADPLLPLLTRLMHMLEEGFGSALEHGHALQGDGWKLTQNELTFRRGKDDQNELTFRRGKDDEILRIEEIAAVEVRDGKMGVWQKGRDTPCVQFPHDGRNVWLMQLLIIPRLKLESPEGGDASGLGRILFERRSGWATVVGVSLIGIAGVVAGFVLLFMDGIVLPIVGAVLLLLSPLAWAAAYGCSKGRFRVHERGVYQKNLRGENRLMYPEVASFSYSTTRNFHNGAYVGTDLYLRFDPISGCKSGPIYFATQVKNQDADLEELRDFVAGVIAERMQQQLASGEIVRWTENLAFRPDGIAYTPAGFFGRKETALLTHENYGGWNMNQGVFYLFQTGQKNAVMSEQVSAANFYPGFFLLLSLYQQPAANEAAQG